MEISVEQGYGGYGDCGGIAYGGGGARQIQEYEENIKELRRSNKIQEYEENIKELRRSNKIQEYEENIKELRRSNKIQEYEENIKELRRSNKIQRASHLAYSADFMLREVLDDCPVCGLVANAVGQLFDSP